MYLWIAYRITEMASEVNPMDYLSLQMKPDGEENSPGSSEEMDSSGSGDPTCSDLSVSKIGPSSRNETQQPEFLEICVKDEPLFLEEGEEDAQFVLENNEGTEVKQGLKMDNSHLNVPIRNLENARKRVAELGTSKRALAKRARHSGKPPTYPTCKHSLGTFSCKSLSREDVDSFNSKFYSSADKQAQDTFILKHTYTEEPKRRRKAHPTRTRNKSIKFFATKSNSNSVMIPVCKKTFTDILAISGNRVHGVLSRFEKSRCLPRENRGGDRKTKMYQSRSNSVQKFIESFTISEKHYCRSKNEKYREYLPSELSIAAMCRMYNKQTKTELKVTETFFRRIFNINFNLGFGSPRIDVCSTCVEIKHQISVEQNQEIVAALITKLNLHGKRADAYYELLNEDRQDVFTLSFACQKNLILPKIPDNSSYHKRHISFYNVSVVNGSSPGSYIKQNVSSNWWLEGEYFKGANEICSALYNHLLNIDLGQNVKTVRIICDGCPGQSKNPILVAMCSYWLHNCAPSQVTSIELVFPVTGHSFIPPDRVFGHLENEVKKLQEIILPESYVDIISKYSSTYHLGVDYNTYDWKSYCKIVLNAIKKWHFNVSSCKRVILKKNLECIEVKGEPFYTCEMNAFRTLTRKDKSLEATTLPIVPYGYKMSCEKLNDVNKLLIGKFGLGWKTLDKLAYYKGLMLEGGVAEVKDSELCCLQQEVESDFYMDLDTRI